MKKILVLGTGGHAKSCIDVIEKQKKFRILGIIENKQSNKKVFMGYPVLGNDKDLLSLKKKCSNVLIGVGQIRNPNLRSNIFLKLKKIGFNFPVIISPKAYVSKNCFTPYSLLPRQRLPPWLWGPGEYGVRSKE